MRIYLIHTVYSTSIYIHQQHCIWPYIILHDIENSYTAIYSWMVYIHTHYLCVCTYIYIWNTGCMLFQISSKKNHPIKCQEPPYTERRHLQFFYYGAAAPWRREIVRRIFFNWKMWKSHHIFGPNYASRMQLTSKNPPKLCEQNDAHFSKIASQMSD